MQEIISNNYYLFLGVVNLLISKDLILAVFNDKFNKSFFEHPRLFITTFIIGLDFILIYSILQLIGRYLEFSNSPLYFPLIYIITVKSLFTSLLIVGIFEEKS